MGTPLPGLPRHPKLRATVLSGKVEKVEKVSGGSVVTLTVPSSGLPGFQAQGQHPSLSHH